MSEGVRTVSGKRRHSIGSLSERDFAWLIALCFSKQNGIVYGYTEGVTVTGELMLSNDFLNEASTKLACLHSIKYEVPGIKFKTQLERVEIQFGQSFKGK